MLVSGWYYWVVVVGVGLWMLKKGRVMLYRGLISRVKVRVFMLMLLLSC